MYLSDERAGQLTGGIWMVGLGILMYTGKWWPGIMFVIGVSSIVQGLVEGRGRYAFHGGLWCIAIGIWATMHFHPAVFLIAVGGSMILPALVGYPGKSKPKPFADHSMD